MIQQTPSHTKQLVHTSLQYVPQLIPLLVWYILFTCLKKLPNQYKAPVDTHTLPALEHFLFQSFPHRWLTPTVFLDFMAMIPYCLHPLLPFIISTHLFFRYNFTKVFQFLWCFGLLNALAVLFQFSFPTAPPWYFEIYGTAPADYSVVGHPGRLGEIDKHLGVNIWTTIYHNNPVVFGAMPSLHAAWPFLCALFYEGSFSIPVWIYVLWVWMAAIYLQHHFFLDVIAGGTAATILFVLCCRPSLFLPLFSPFIPFFSSVKHLTQKLLGSKLLSFAFSSYSDCSELCGDHLTVSGWSEQREEIGSRKQKNILQMV
eukprot:TRINITY_DN7380_c0_g1_i2.p1 TRINITY_DN7380_c0_g1~~TRINITY_DN7380_c0_g1_i2.p1  ORF type:complete len:314 (-),score=49.54 TRINITY_DN7380_c0_g1_i2:29-970(-)